jgi:hypothetical protein
MEKWVKKFHIQRKGLMLGRLDGVYTAATKGNLVFGGWTKQGQSRFNYFCKLVQEDRSSDRSAHVEKEFLVAMQKTPEGKKFRIVCSNECRAMMMMRVKRIFIMRN